MDLRSFMPNDEAAMGASSAAEIQELAKALTTGSGIVADGTTGGGALRVQSLESTLKTLQFDKQMMMLWNAIAKKKASSIAEEFTLETSYGSTGEGFVPEITTPGVVDTNYERDVRNVKFMGITKELSLPSTLVRNQVGIEAEQVKTGTLALLERLEWGLFEADSSKNPLAFDGIGKQIQDWATANAEDADIVKDMRGAALTPEDLEDICLVTAERYGKATDLVLPAAIKSDLAKQMYAKGRWRQDNPPTDMRLGLKVNQFQADTGALVNFMPHLLLRYNEVCPTVAKGASYPSAPVATGGTTSDADTQLDADTYYYKVVAWGANGRSAPSSLVTQAVLAANSIVLTITNPADTVSFRIYRGTASTDLRLLDTVACSATGTTTYTDDGSEISGTHKAYMLEMDSDQVLAFHRLADLMKLDLALLGTAKRFMLLLYGTPIVYNPRKCVLVKNIGRYTN